MENQEKLQNEKLQHGSADITPLPIMPVIDMAEVQKAANEYALQGVKQTLKDFFSGYNSPFTKQIREHFESQVPSFTMDITGVMVLLDEYKEKENVMIFSKSSIGRLLYGTIVSNTPEAVTLANCVEIDFSKVGLLHNNDLGSFSSSITYLKDCIISPVIQEVTCFEVIFIFSCSEEVKEYLNDIISKEQCPQRQP